MIIKEPREDIDTLHIACGDATRMDVFEDNPLNENKNGWDDDSREGKDYSVD